MSRGKPNENGVIIPGNGPFVGSEALPEGLEWHKLSRVTGSSQQRCKESEVRIVRRKRPAQRDYMDPSVPLWHHSPSRTT